MARRALLAALLLYVTLDLALPMMPGAFEFDVAQSVESAQRTRAGSAAGDAVGLLAASGAAAEIAPQPVRLGDQPAPARASAPHRDARPRRLPRERLAGVPASEDPH
jgi:hypothetical protein